MKKTFWSKKAVSRSFKYIFTIPYCDAQYLLNFDEPFGYHSGVYGWNCDFYEVTAATGERVCLSTGYRPNVSGSVEAGPKITEEYENRARVPVEGSYKELKENVHGLLVEYVTALLMKEE